MLGISLVLKAWLLSVSADIWGDAPYTQAAQPDTYPTPVYDPQKTVYDSLQNVLAKRSRRSAPVPAPVRLPRSSFTKAIG